MARLLRECGPFVVVPAVYGLGMTTPPEPVRVSASDEAARYVCCGGKGNQQGEWVPGEGKPQVAACAWCNLSGRYWRDEVDA